MWHLETSFSCGLGSTELKVGLDDLKQFYDLSLDLLITSVQNHKEMLLFQSKIKKQIPFLKKLLLFEHFLPILS